MEELVAHPSEAEWWDWDDGNEAELANHRIRAREVEQVFSNDPVFMPNKKHRAGDWKMVGRTSGGRALTVIIRYDEAALVIRPITGWDASTADRTRYLNGEN